VKIRFSKQFDKQIDKLKNPKQKGAIANAIAQIGSANSIADIPNVKKMKGHDSAYRIRVGDFRIGFFLEEDEVFVSTVLHRKDIYNHFP